MRPNDYDARLTTVLSQFVGGRYEFLMIPTKGDMDVQYFCSEPKWHLKTARNQTPLCDYYINNAAENMYSLKR